MANSLSLERERSGEQHSTGAGVPIPGTQRNSPAPEVCRERISSQKHRRRRPRPGRRGRRLGARAAPRLPSPRLERRPVRPHGRLLQRARRNRERGTFGGRAAVPGALSAAGALPMPLRVSFCSFSFPRRAATFSTQPLCGDERTRRACAVTSTLGAAPTRRARVQNEDPFDTWRGDGGDARGVVLVTGATGGVGSRVVGRLLAKGARVRALVRDVEKARAILMALPMAEGGTLEVVTADLSQPATVRKEMFRGVRAVVSCAAVKVQPKEGDADRSKCALFALPQSAGDADRSWCALFALSQSAAQAGRCPPMQVRSFRSF